MITANTTPAAQGKFAGFCVVIMTIYVLVMTIHIVVRYNQGEALETEKERKYTKRERETLVSLFYLYLIPYNLLGIPGSKIIFKSL